MYRIHLKKGKGFLTKKNNNTKEKREVLLTLPKERSEMDPNISPSYIHRAFFSKIM